MWHQTTHTSNVSSAKKQQPLGQRSTIPGPNAKFGLYTWASLAGQMYKLLRVNAVSRRVPNRSLVPGTAFGA